VSDIPPQAIKTGMLCSAAIIDVLAGTLRALYPAGRDLPPVIIDPVTISTSGHTLLPTSAISALKTQIVPLGLVLTPNVLEAEMLLSNEGVHGEGFEAKARTLAEGKRRITDLDTMLSSARELAGLGCPNILLKGGHLALDLPVVQAQLRALEQSGAVGPADVLWPEDEGIRILESINGSSAQEKVVVDVLWESASSRCTAIVSRLISTENTHGTGCTLSAALAVYLGKGLNRTFVAQTALHHRRMC
jgi:hydroxymethylpyrimidine/phosphomethylpyrimidine kinase